MPTETVKLTDNRKVHKSVYRLKPDIITIAEIPNPPNWNPVSNWQTIVRVPLHPARKR